MMAVLKRWWRYLLGKKSELADLEIKDAVLARVVVDIHRHRTGKQMRFVPLDHLHRIHRLDRPNAIAATTARIGVVREHAEALRGSGRLSKEDLNDILPSVSAIKVVREANDRFIAFEGNGRLAALQEGLGKDSGVSVEVEEYVFSRYGKILKRMHKVRRMNRIPQDFFGMPEVDAKN